MRLLLACIAICLSGSLSFGQADSTKTTQQPVEKQVAIPGIDTPTSGGGLTAQEPTNIMPVSTPQNTDKKRKRKNQPPSDPRAFGVSVPIEPDRKEPAKP